MALYLADPYALYQREIIFQAARPWEYVIPEQPFSRLLKSSSRFIRNRLSVKVSAPRILICFCDAGIFSDEAEGELSGGRYFSSLLAQRSQAPAHRSVALKRVILTVTENYLHPDASIQQKESIVASFYVFMTLLCVFGISVGQLLFKQAALTIHDTTDWKAWAFNGVLIAALCLYGVTTLAWVWILRKVPLHLAYPFMGLAFLIVPLLEHFVFGSALHLRTFVGGGLILAGVLIAASV